MVSKMRFEINKIVATVEDGEAQYGLFHRFRWFIQSKFANAQSPLLPIHCWSVDAPSALEHYGFRYWTLHLQILSKHSGCSKAEKQQYQDQMWALLQRVDFIQENTTHSR